MFGRFRQFAVQYQTWLFALVSVCLIFIAYRSFATHYFFSDDFVWMYQGDLIRDNIWNIFRIKITSFFSPVVNIYFFLGQIFFHQSFVLYHSTCLLLHLVNVVLVYSIARRLTHSSIGACCAGIFLAVTAYPLEAVVWISAVMHLLVTTIVLMGLFCYIRYRDMLQMRWLVATFVCAILAFFTKESGIIFVPMLCGLYLCLQSDSPWRLKKMQHLIPFFFLLGGLMIYAYQAQHQSMWVTQGVFRFSIKAAYPLAVSLVGLLDVSSASWLVQHPLLLGFTVVIFIALGSVFLFRCVMQRKIFLFGLFAAVLGFLPVIFFYFGTWHTLAQSRYAYLPSFGVALMVATVVHAFLGQKKLLWRYVLVAMCLLFFITRNVYGIRKTDTIEYGIIDAQMRGMVASFRLLEPLLTPSHDIVVAGQYPFPGNEYYRFLYRSMVDPTRTKSIDHWRSIPDKRTAIELYAHDPNVILVEWDNVHFQMRRMYPQQ